MINKHQDQVYIIIINNNNKWEMIVQEKEKQPTWFGWVGLREEVADAC